MRRIIIAAIAGLWPLISAASGGGAHLEKADIDLGNKASLQRGARYYVNYCIGCHSLQYQQYQRLGEDLEIPRDLVIEDLMFGLGRIGDYMTNAMPAEEAAEWFGKAPPDLSVVARSRGSDWLYTYLTSFYADDSRPFGVNNLVFKDVGMPHVLVELQGLRKAVFETEKDEETGQVHERFVRFEPVTEGSMSEAEYEQAVRDLVGFLTYVGEPAKLVRGKIGVWVLIYLAILFVFAYALKKEYWKDVH